MTNWITTGVPNVIFEDSDVGRLKKEVWDASSEEIDRILAQYEVPSAPELAKPGSYIQTTPRAQVVENR
ncbi:MAG: creatininase family protein, partial [Dehalococcoidia bacterium]|nr:creatininase family protein [Dehalococcoidia bacterium]